jgi:hypothetical protein
MVTGCSSPGSPHSLPGSEPERLIQAVQPAMYQVAIQLGLLPNKANGC